MFYKQEDWEKEKFVNSTNTRELVYIGGVRKEFA